MTSRWDPRMEMQTPRAALATARRRAGPVITCVLRAPCSLYASPYGIRIPVRSMSDIWPSDCFGSQLTPHSETVRTNAWGLARPQDTGRRETVMEKYTFPIRNRSI
jgi:hypothetical protein